MSTRGGLGGYGLTYLDEELELDENELDELEDFEELLLLELDEEELDDEEAPSVQYISKSSTALVKEL